MCRGRAPRALALPSLTDASAAKRARRFSGHALPTPLRGGDTLRLYISDLMAALDAASIGGLARRLTGATGRAGLNEQINLN
jgi:hypothetical protein